MHLSSVQCAVDPLCVEEIFKAIYLLQYVDDCEDILETLKQRLVKVFDDVPEKESCKIYGGIQYFPSGLCMPVTKYNASEKVLVYTDIHELRILLPPWTSTTKVPDKKDSRVANNILITLRDNNRLWYYQVCEAMGLKYNIYGHYKSDLAKCVMAIEATRGMDLKELKTAGFDDLKSKRDKLIGVVYRELTHSSCCVRTVARDEDRIPYLTQESREALIGIIQSRPRMDRWDTYKMLEDIATDICTNSKAYLAVKFYPHGRYDDPPELFGELYPQFLMVEDPNCRKVLTRWGVIPADKTDKRKGEK